MNGRNVISISDLKDNNFLFAIMCFTSIFAA